MKQLMAALGQDVKASGKDWIARCPVHGDKDFAMSISQNSQGMVIAHCHACGANGLELYQYLELDLDELFGGRELPKPELYQVEATPDYQYQAYKPYISAQLRDLYGVDLVCIDIHEYDLKIGRRPTLVDKRRYRLAVARAEGVRQKFTL